RALQDKRQADSECRVVNRWLTSGKDGQRALLSKNAVFVAADAYGTGFAKWAQRPPKRIEERRNVKAVVANLFPTLAGMLLVVPFLVVAIVVGHYVLTGAGRTPQHPLLVVLALCGVAYSVVAARPAGTTLSVSAARRKRS